MGRSIDDIYRLLETSTDKLSKEISSVKMELLKEISDVTKDMNEKYKQVTECNVKLESRIDYLEDSLARQRRQHQLCISGIPVLANEDIKSIFERICVIIEFNTADSASYNVFRFKQSPKLDKVEVRTTRLKSKSNAKVNDVNVSTNKFSQLIIVQFSNAIDKSTFWFKYLVNPKFNLNALQIDGNARVWISEHLTKRNYAIFRKCGELRRAGKICKYFTKNGLCYVCIKSGDSPNIASNEAELNEML